eukprot:GHVU01175422.1.p2 GENE.GHVU01175422.1~~GHVU01175422.1.p2  ORF type:complete len:138 (-),score=13.41 GHVU01175422.1:254-667(-)
MEDEKQMAAAGIALFVQFRRYKATTAAQRCSGAAATTKWCAAGTYMHLVVAASLIQEAPFGFLCPGSTTPHGRGGRPCSCAVRRVRRRKCAAGGGHRGDDPQMHHFRPLANPHALRSGGTAACGPQVRVYVVSVTAG